MVFHDEDSHGAPASMDPELELSLQRGARKHSLHRQPCARSGRKGQAPTHYPDAFAHPEQAVSDASRVTHPVPVVEDLDHHVTPTVLFMTSAPYRNRDHRRLAVTHGIAERLLHNAVDRGVDKFAKTFAVRRNGHSVVNLGMPSTPELDHISDRRVQAEFRKPD